jgi:hypothetical protein
MPNPYHSPLQRAFLATALCFLQVSVCVAWPCLAPSCSTAIRLSSVSATDRPPTRGLPRPNCYSHVFSLYTLLPVLPDSWAVSVALRAAVWPRESVTLILSEFVWDRQCSFAEEKQGHQWHTTQHNGDLAHVEAWISGGK